MSAPQQASLFPFLSAKKATDICAKKHRGNKHSVVANPSPESKAIMRERIRLAVYGYGADGLTLKEACQIFKKVPNEISGRFTALKADGKIFDSDRSRDGCTVYVTRLAWVNGSTEEP